MKNTINQHQILSFYVEDVLEQDSEPKSIYKFAKNHGFSENDFYNYFSSFEDIEKHFFVFLFEDSINLLKNSEQYSTYDARTQLLSFYFTYFEMLTANRSFVLLQLPHNSLELEKIKKLSNLKSLFIEFYNALAIEKLDLKKDKWMKMQDKGRGELAWIQFLMTLKFWMNDSSVAFEKTDIFIEKSIHSSFDLMNVTALKSALDFGKFLWKEKMNF